MACTKAVPVSVLVQRQRYGHTSSCAGRFDIHLTASRFHGQAHETQSHAGMPAMGGGLHIETRPVVGHFELDLMADGEAADTPQSNGHGGRLGKFVDVTQELLRGPVQQCGGPPVYFHPVVGRLQVHGDPAFAQRKGQTVNRPRDAKRIEIDRMRIGKNATDCDNPVAR